jgi:integrase
VPRAPRGRGSVFEDKGRGRWVAQIKVDGKVTRRYAHTQEDAWVLRDKLVADLRAGLAPDSNSTLAEYLEDWLRVTKVRPSTLTGYRSKVHNYIAPPRNEGVIKGSKGPNKVQDGPNKPQLKGIGHIPLSKLTPFHVDHLIAEMEKHGLSPATIRQTRAILQAALKRALRYKLVTENVAALVDVPELNRAERTALTPDQARAFLESLRGERLEALYATAVLLGLRQGELLGLRWQDVEWSRPGLMDSSSVSPGATRPSPRTPDPAEAGASAILHIEQTLGRFEGQYIKGKPKTSNSRRTLPVPAVLAALLSEWRTKQKAEFLKYGARPEHDLVFTTQGGNPINGSWLTHDLYRRLESAGLPRVRFHDLRHSAASLLLAEGFGMREVMLVLGHSTIAQSMDVYAHIPEETIRLKMQRLDDWRAR